MFSTTVSLDGVETSCSVGHAPSLVLAGWSDSSLRSGSVVAIFAPLSTACRSHYGETARCLIAALGGFVLNCLALLLLPLLGGPIWRYSCVLVIASAAAARTALCALQLDTVLAPLAACNCSVSSDPKWRCCHKMPKLRRVLWLWCQKNRTCCQQGANLPPFTSSSFLTSNSSFVT